MPLEWAEVVNLFENVDISQNGLDTQASQLQAMHIAYALSDNLEKASDCLQKASQIASRLNDATIFFTPKFYRYVIKTEFILANGEMTKSLKISHLWDGTPLLKGAPNSLIL
jgi:hypothetical protein